MRRGVITKDGAPKEIDTVFNFVIDESVYDWKNVYIARYYEFSSICIVDDNEE